MTVKTRLTLLIAGAGFIASLLFSAVIFFELIEQPFDLLDNVLKEEAKRTTRLIVHKEKESGLPTIGSTSQAGEDLYWIEIVEQGSRRMLFQSAPAKSIKLPRVRPGNKAIVNVPVFGPQGKWDPDGNKMVHFRIRTFTIHLEGRSFDVQVARPIEKLNEEIWELMFGIIAGLIFSTMALFIISHYIAGKILQPIGRMKDLTREISENNLDQRLPVGEERDEFSDLARTINRMLDRLQYSFARQRDFLFDTSHELKTPLTTMRLAVDQICSADSEDASSVHKDNLLRLNSQVLRMERLVKDLLNLSAMETLAHIDFKPVRISDLLSSLVDEYQFLAEARHIKMDVRLPEALTIDGDAEKLHRAFSNLLDNAVKYNIDGGQIELAGDASGGDLTVTVVNTGPGVDEIEIPKVFDPFYRVEKSRSLLHGGSGLGLAIVKRIIDLHGGKVTLESRQGEWTRVTVGLPIRRDAR